MQNSIFILSFYL
ncbi:uncharacterized protein FFMR_13287 [Fusarium fujikuroi]|nr:uncharacterized protein FFMR_13287 [Fusarium fujikuroi]